MTQFNTQKLKDRIDYWWLHLLAGILLVIIGIWASTRPMEAYATLSLYFAVAMLITGFFEVVYAITARHSIHDWGWSLAMGLFDLIAGAYLLAHPALTMEIIPVILGLWILFRGIAAIGVSLALKSVYPVKWALMLVLGILITLFGTAVLFLPILGIINIVIFTSLSFITAGLFRIVHAIRLKKLSQPMIP